MFYHGGRGTSVLEAGARGKSAFGSVSVGEKDVEENADNVAEESSGSAARNQGLNGPISKSIAKRNRHRETYCCKHQSYQEPFSHLIFPVKLLTRLLCGQQGIETRGSYCKGAGCLT